MCGIAGIWQTNGAPVDAATLARMRDRLISRGPDDAGIWIGQNVGLGHRRLSILDLSPLGHQPMVDQTTGSVIVHNGEVYNFQEIRKELEAKGVAFKSQTDTEVILKAYRVWGTSCLERFNGMFAFAIWDAPRRRLFIARDRIGIKPLYYYHGADVFLFASRLKPLLAHPSCPREIDPESLGLYLDLSYVPAPWSILKNVRKLEPGHFLWGSENGFEDKCYWDIADTPIDKSLQDVPDEEMIDRLDALLRDSIKLRMISDVPLGAFLSGGVDSSTVVAIMSRCSTSPPETFTIGFQEKSCNEAAYAKKIAGLLNTNHHQKIMGSDDLLGLLDELQEHYDEPFADSSALPTMMVSRFARQHVTVSLSGDGGDELFAGYPQYDVLSGLRRGFLAPRFLRRGAGHLLAHFGNHRLSMLGNSLLKSDLLESFAYVKSILKAFDRRRLFDGNGTNSAALFRSRARCFGAIDEVSMASRLDLSYYLVDGILQKLDVASMSTSLEARVPILDHRVVQFACSLPISFKRRGHGGKWLLKQVLERYVPKTYFERPKGGFIAPINEWFRGELREMILDELSVSRIKEFGCLNPEAVQSLVELHLSGKRNTHPILWSLLCLLHWKHGLDGNWAAAADTDPKRQLPMPMAS